MLTLAPESWKRIKISNYFEVSEYLVQSSKVKHEQGILSLPGRKTWKPYFKKTYQSFRE